MTNALLVKPLWRNERALQLTHRIELYGSLLHMDPSLSKIWKFNCICLLKSSRAFSRKVGLISVKVYCLKVACLVILQEPQALFFE